MEISEILNILSKDFALRAFMASCLVGVTCGILGCFIVLRNMALIGDALSHAILPGVVIGFVIAGQSVVAFFSGAVAAGLFTAIAITWIQQNFKARDDSAIGVVFSTMFSLGVIGLSQITRKEGVHLDLKDFLFGNVLGVSNSDLILTGIITIYVLISVIIFYRSLFITTFQSVTSKALGIPTETVHYFLMLLLSFTVVSSLQSVGVILVVAMLITPASTALLLTRKLHYALIWAGTIGFTSAGIGLIIAIAGNFPPGPVMTLVATFFYILTALFRPEKGVFISFLRQNRKNKQIITEDLLKACVILFEKNKNHCTPTPTEGEDNFCTLQNIHRKTNIPMSKIRKGMQTLSQKNLVSKDNFRSPSGETIWHPTAKGIEAAYRLIRAHRLWETYMVTEMRQNSDQIHPTAERFEHHLPDDFISHIEEKLGNPILDPHGSPIPKNQNQKNLLLNSLKSGEKAIVIIQQPASEVSAKLWELGVTPNQAITMTFNPNYPESPELLDVEIEVSGKKVTYPGRLADKTLVSLL